MRYLIFLFFAAFVSAESLHYTINWPSGLSLGETTLAATPKDSGWNFDLDIDASIPGFAVREHDHSRADSGLCSIQLDKSYTHGQRKTEERITFDQQNQTIARGRPGGDTTETSVSPCARDALTFIQFARKELAEGRIAPEQQVIFGAIYQVRFEYTGAQSVKLGEQRIDADRIAATITGPASNYTVEIFFAHDAGRTPLLAKLPLPLGTFTVELLR